MRLLDNTRVWKISQNLNIGMQFLIVFLFFEHSFAEYSGEPFKTEHTPSLKMYSDEFIKIRFFDQNNDNHPNYKPYYKKSDDFQTESPTKRINHGNIVTEYATQLIEGTSDSEYINYAQLWKETNYINNKDNRIKHENNIENSTSKSFKETFHNSPIIITAFNYIDPKHLELAQYQQQNINSKTIEMDEKFPQSIYKINNFQSHNDINGDYSWSQIDGNKIKNDIVNGIEMIYINGSKIFYKDKVTSEDIVENGTAYVFSLASEKETKLDKIKINKSHNENQFYAYNASDGSSTAKINISNLISKNNFSVKTSSSSTNSQQNNLSESISSSINNMFQQKQSFFKVNKVQNDNNLPTYTVKNIFSPSGYSFIEAGKSENDQKYEQSLLKNEESNYKEQSGFIHRSAKLLFDDKSGLSQSDSNMFQLTTALQTITYYGFAQFTTKIGDTLIIFSPSTSSETINFNQITSIRGEATLYPNIHKNFNNNQQNEKHVTIKVTQDLIEPSFATQKIAPTVRYVVPAKINVYEEQTKSTVEDYSIEEQENSVHNKDASLTYTEKTKSIFNSKENETSTENVEHKQKTTLFSLASSNIETIKEPMLTKPSNEDILKALASIAAAEVIRNKQMDDISKMLTIKTIDRQQEIKISGGATTIFFEDDPFQAGGKETSNISYNTEPYNILYTNTFIPNKKNENENDHLYSSIERNHIYEGDNIEEKTQTKTEENKRSTYLTKSFNEETKQIYQMDNESKQNANKPKEEKENQEYTTKMLLWKTYNEQTDKSIDENLSYIEQDTILITGSSDSYMTTDITKDKEDENMLKVSDRIYGTNTDVQDESLMYEEDNIGDKDDEDEYEEEIALIYKTLYTTYTYLTTFFHDSTTTVSSHTEIVTNILTLTQSNYDEKNVNYETTIQPPDIESTSIVFISNLQSAVTTEKETTQDLNLAEIDELIRIEDKFSDDHLSDSTPYLSSSFQSALHLTTEQIKTYFTTFTYYTTMFDEDDTHIMSRIEVHTNYVNDDKKKITNGRNIAMDCDATETIYKQISSKILKTGNQKTSNVNHNDESFQQYTDYHINNSNDTRNYINDNKKSSERISDIIENETEMIIAVRNNSNMEEKNLKEILKLEDQISSESNTEDILPSPSLLLQTSYTTFTYYTTMYESDVTNVVSRLETITNIFTKTMHQMQNAKDITSNIKVYQEMLPITYFTTFTYWTTLVKDGQITTISHEETLSNVSPTQTVIFPETPTMSLTSTPTLSNNLITSDTVKQELDLSTIVSFIDNFTTQNKTQLNENNENDDKGEDENMPYIKPSPLLIDPITFFTTFTYYTTSYASDTTIIHSRFETITNVVKPSITSTNTSIIDQSYEISNDLSAKKEASSDKKPKSTPTLPDEKLILLDIRTIVDADEISTFYYTTKIFDSSINGEFTRINQTSSTADINEKKKSLQLFEQESSSNYDYSSMSTRTYKTGFVRSIVGTILSNNTTTLYESKVIGTIIDGRYAQIVESTSSYLVKKSQTISPETAHYSLQSTTTILLSDAQIIQQSNFSSVSEIKPASVDVLQSSNLNQKNLNEAEISDDSDYENNPDRRNSDKGFVGRKKIFAPVIRPFASRNRPHFAPKRKNLSSVGATIITRSDVTPTIIATPAFKVESSSRGRFNIKRISNNSGFFSMNTASVNGSLNKQTNSIQTANIPRRFPRPSKVISTSQLVNLNRIQSSIQSGTNTLVKGLSSRIQSIQAGTGSARRGANLKGSSEYPTATGRQISSNYQGNLRSRIGPTSTVLSLSNINSFSNFPDLNTNKDEDATQQLEDLIDDDEEIDITTAKIFKNNSFLKFNRPGSLYRSTSSSNNINRSRNQLQISTRRNPLIQRVKSITPATTVVPTTEKSRQNPFQRLTPANFQNRPRPQNNLFPPRGLFQQQNFNQDLGKNKKSDDDNDDFNEDNDDYDDEINEDDNERRKRHHTKTSSNSKLIKKRSKRQTSEFGIRSINFRNRFKRPPTRNTVVAEERSDANPEEDYQLQQPDNQQTSTTRKRGSRYSNRKPKNLTTASSSSPHNNNSKNNNNNRIKPTKPTSGRTPFTLRPNDKDSNISKPQNQRNNFRRLPTAASRRSTTNNRPKVPRLKTFSSSVGEPVYPSRSSHNRQRTTNRGRATTGSRSRGTTFDYVVDQISPSFDGTITVTHYIPTQITIPIVNGKLTDYKNVITAKPVTEIVGPNQYKTQVNRNGNTVIFLNNEDTNINTNGDTEVTQFVLNETPTTTIIFTPTTIRGRRTSFSHIIPSTVYNVENVISTVHPQIAANAPLANILLSQLLLGNIGLQHQNPINPLLGLQQPFGTPTTEYKTRTTTYITTVTNGMSTIIPLTFHGKEILTTIYDTSTNVITATEFITETIVVTQTQSAQPQVNSLLLLLQQQQHQQQAAAVLAAQHQQNHQLEIFNQIGLPVSAVTGVGLNSSPIKDPYSNQLSLNDNIQQDINSNLQKLGQDEYALKDGNDILNSEVLRKKNAKFSQINSGPNDFLNQNNESKRHGQNRSPNKSKKNKKDRHNAQKPIEYNQVESSIITLYISGRRPGEFSTVLSTFYPDSSLHKREIFKAKTCEDENYDFDEMSKIENNDTSYEQQFYSDDNNNKNDEPKAVGNSLKKYFFPINDTDLRIKNNIKHDNMILKNELFSSQDQLFFNHETQSLESIIGDVSLWFDKSPTRQKSDSMKTILPSSQINSKTKEILKQDYNFKIIKN